MGSKQIKIILIIFNIISVITLIALSNLEVIPLERPDFIFWSLIVFALSLYRPGWAFLLLIGTIVLENVNLAPESFALSIRPYQFLAFFLFFGLAIRLITKKFPGKLPRLKWPDFFVILLLVGSFLSVLNSPEKSLSLKLSLVLSSFVLIYFLCRYFLENLEDIKKILPFFIPSSVLVALYALWQNLRFIKDQESFTTMAARPNSTFFEADWLGMFLSLASIIILGTALWIKNKEDWKDKTKIIIEIILFLSLTSVFVALIITVSRSAWAGAAASFLTFFLLLFVDSFLLKKRRRWENFLPLSLKTVFSLGLSFILIWSFNLTNFKLTERLESSAGKQKITIACSSDEKAQEIGEEILSMKELESYSCYHINLEDIREQTEKGMIVKEIIRPDPNIEIRSQIYSESLKTIKKHPLLGIGWGSIGKILGEDSQGNSFNASNIFLEIWLGAGILGLLSFLALWIFIPIYWISSIFKEADWRNKVFALTIISIWISLSIFNLFNSAIMLGVFWLFFASALCKKTK